MFNFFKKDKYGTAERAMDGLRNIKQAFDEKLLKVEQGRLHDDIYLHADNAQGSPRLTYIMLSPTVQNELVASCTMIYEREWKDLNVWSIEWAVAEDHRNMGFSLSIVTKALNEFKNGISRKGGNAIWLEAVVSQEDKFANSLASKIIGNCESQVIEDTKERINNYFSKQMIHPDVSCSDGQSVSSSLTTSEGNDRFEDKVNSLMKNHEKLIMEEGRIPSQDEIFSQISGLLNDSEQQKDSSKDIDKYCNYTVTKDGFIVKDDETGHILEVTFKEDNMFHGVVNMPEQDIKLLVHPWKLGDNPFKNDNSYNGNQTKPTSHWFSINPSSPFSQIMTEVERLQKG